MHHALETIDYQYKDSFPDALETVITQIYKSLTLKSSVKANDPDIQKIHKLVLERFGMRVHYVPELNFFTSAAIIPFFKDFQRSSSSLQVFPSLFVGSVQSNALQRLTILVKDREKTLKKIDNKTGFINTKLAKMGGYMSQVSHYLILDFKFFKEHGVTPAEVTAIVLHELGHAFDGMEEHHRLQTTNRAIMDILVDVHDNKMDKALYKYKNTFTEKEYMDAQLSSSKDRQDFCGVLAMTFLKQTESQLQSSKYDETNFENMADTFATRFGRGKDLASALAKLHGVKIEDNGGIRVVMATLEILSLAAVFLLVPIYGFVLYTIIMSYLLRVSGSPMVYDDFAGRLQRIRNTVVNGIKGKGLPDEMLKDALEQIEFIEKMSMAGREYKSLMSDLGDLMYSDARKDRYYVDLQQSIERQLNNRLFVQAARVRVLA